MPIEIRVLLRRVG